MCFHFGSLANVFLFILSGSISQIIKFINIIYNMINIVLRELLIISITVVWFIHKQTFYNIGIRVKNNILSHI